MARKSRIDAPGGHDHIIARGIERKASGVMPIFFACLFQWGGVRDGMLIFHSLR
jgi:hypothetical protein